MMTVSAMPPAQATQEIKARLKRLQTQMRQIEQRIEMLNKERSEVETAIAQTAKALDEYRLVNGRPLKAAGLGKVTARNMDFYRAWAAIQRIYKDTYQYHYIDRGVQQRTLYSAARRVLPELKPETFRSYLHRLKKAGHLEKRDKLWHLAERKEWEGTETMK